MNVKFSALLFSAMVFFFFSCSERQSKEDTSASLDFYVASENRLAAEWEPALGTMIVWPLCVPHKLVVALASDNHLYTLVQNKTSQADALKWYLHWGIDTSRVTFIYAEAGIDSWWVRDWGPGAVFTSDGTMKLADGKYIYSTPVSGIGCNDSLSFLYTTSENKIIPTKIDDNATVPLGQGLNMSVIDLPFINTGGNVFTDGIGTAFSTCVLTNENRFHGVPDESFFRLNRELLGLKHYNVISNFEDRGIQHIDCLLKLIDEETLLVAEPPADHALHPIYEKIVTEELSTLIGPYGRPYKILRLKTYRYKGEALAAYTNSIIINRNIYVPLFNLKEDTLALNRWREVMPGYTVKGFQFIFSEEPAQHPEMREKYPYLGWNNGDALHCRTRAVWDPEMLWITVKSAGDTATANSNAVVSATIIDYSKKGLVENASTLYWREKGKVQWGSVALIEGKNKNNFTAAIPSAKSGTTIEYYIAASSNSGKKETRPRTAPAGYYTVVFK